MFYVYLLVSEEHPKEYYIGSTNDLRRRLAEHNLGDSPSTARYKPWKLVYYEAYITEELARMREKRLKHHGSAKHELMKRVLPSPSFQKSVKTGAGFTLIELLVSVAIIIVMTGGVIVNYNSYNDSQRTRSSVLTVKNNLRYAQGRAYNGEKPTSGCTQLLGYQVSFTATTYSVQASCTEGLAGTAQDFSLDTGISFSPVPPAIIFRVLSSGIDTDTTIIAVGSGKSYQFLVSRSGDMSEVSQVP